MVLVLLKLILFISISNYLFIVYENMIDFCIVTLNPATLLDSLILVVGVFYIQEVTLSVNANSFSYSFLIPFFIYRKSHCL